MMQAKTKAGEAYLEMAGKLDWASARDAEQVVVLEDMINGMAAFNGSEAVLVYGTASGGPGAFESVNDVLMRLESRLQRKRAAVLKAEGGKVSGLMREVMKARMGMATEAQGEPA